MSDDKQDPRKGNQQLAERLKKARTDKGLTQTELAAHADWGDSGKTKVSKIESGRQLPSEADIDQWATATGLSGRLVKQLKAMLVEAEQLRTSYRKRMVKGQAPVQQEYTDLAETTTSFRFFETFVLPRYIQVPEYALAVLSEFKRHASINDVEEAVNVRLSSIRFLYDPAKRFEFLINEPVIRSRRFPPEVMRPQLDRLLSVIGLRNVRFGIYPQISAPTRRLPVSSFELFDDIGFIETALGDGPKLLADDVERLDQDLAEFWADAFEGDDARALILDAINALPDQ